MQRLGLRGGIWGPVSPLKSGKPTLHFSQKQALHTSRRLLEARTASWTAFWYLGPLWHQKISVYTDCRAVFCAGMSQQCRTSSSKMGSNFWSIGNEKIHPSTSGDKSCQDSSQKQQQQLDCSLLQFMHVSMCSWPVICLQESAKLDYPEADRQDVPTNYASFSVSAKWTIDSKWTIYC